MSREKLGPVIATVEEIPALATREPITLGLQLQEHQGSAHHRRKLTDRFSLASRLAIRVPWPVAGYQALTPLLLLLLWDLQDSARSNLVSIRHEIRLSVDLHPRSAICRLLGDVD